MRCCPNHVSPADGTCDKPAVGWCMNSFFDGCEPCCQECPDYDWCGLWGCLWDHENDRMGKHFCGRG